MPNIIKHNAAKIVALSKLLFTDAVANPGNKPLAPMSELLQHDSRLKPSNHRITLSLATA